MGHSRARKFLGCFLCAGLVSFNNNASVQRSLQAANSLSQATTIRVKVGLLQTDAMVFDKQGHFVPNLKREQFDLRVDGKAQVIEFFELVSAGSAYDEQTWSRGDISQNPTKQPVVRTTQGRTLLFFLDDWHLSSDSVTRLRLALSFLINNSIGPDDRVGLFAASRQIETTEKLTGDRSALLRVLDQINFYRGGTVDVDFPLMNEAHAVEIEQNDENVLQYFVESMLGHRLEEMVPQRIGPPLPWGQIHQNEVNEAMRHVRRRAASLAQVSADLAERSLSTLYDLVSAVEAVKGRKTIFFLSDGFVLQTKRSDVIARLGYITTRAARAGIMIYTLDARGLVVGLPDAKTKGGLDSTGVTSRFSQIAAQQDALNTLAADTGGRFLKNTNALDAALIATLKEISRYYLLGWAIDPEKLSMGKYSTIRASIKGRSDLTVRVRQGSLDLSKLVNR